MRSIVRVSQRQLDQKNRVSQGAIMEIDIGNCRLELACQLNWGTYAIDS